MKRRSQAKNATVSQFPNAATSSSQFEAIEHILRFLRSKELAFCACVCDQWRCANVSVISWWSQDLSHGKMTKPLKCSNLLPGSEPFPAFTYTSKYVGKSLTPNRYEAAQVPGCECRVCDAECPCAERNTTSMLRAAKNTPLAWECHARCRCHTNSKKCVFRRSGAYGDGDFDLKVIRRCPLKGWELVSCEPIKRDQSVTAYTGEIISLSDAKERQARGDKARSNQRNFILILDEVISGSSQRGPPISLKTCIDASQSGSAARFVNHSCSPNLVVRPLRRGSFLPDIVFYAKHDIAPGVELTIDYGAFESLEINTNTNTTADAGVGRGASASCTGRISGGVVCRCGSSQCHGFLPFNP